MAKKSVRAIPKERRDQGGESGRELQRRRNSLARRLDLFNALRVECSQRRGDRHADTRGAVLQRIT